MIYTPPDIRAGYDPATWIIQCKGDYRRHLWGARPGWRGSKFIPHDGKTPTFTAQPRVFR